MSAIQQLLTDHIDIWTAAETEKRSGRGRASGNAGSVYGIKKLRELILELAVRGKLVPQDANDEPACELLKGIQAKKAKLIAEGKIKKDKPLAAITEDEKPFELPKGWAYSRLGDAVEIIRGITFPGSEKSKVPEIGRVACLRTTNVQDQIEWDDLLYIGEEFVSREDQYLMPRDIVMSMANSRELVGKVALVGEVIDQQTSFGGFLGVLRPFLIEPRFVMALLRTPHTREELIDSASQTTNIANISLAKLKPLFFAIPPLAEQHRIVAKVDELMALCDQLENQHSNAAEAHEKLVSHLLGTLTQSQSAEDFSVNWQRIAAHFDTLFTTDFSIDALKQTLLQLAVMGKLVPQDANDEPASELLKRIQAEKAKLIAEGKIKKDKPLTPITDDEKPFELPKNWLWVRMGDICRPISSGSTPPAESFQYEDGIPYLKVYNIKNQEVDFDYKKQFVDESYHATKLKRSVIYPGELIMNIVGPPLGKVAIVPSSHPEWNCNQAIVFFGLIKPMSPHYVLDFLKEGSFLNDIELIGTAGQDNISVTKSKNIPVPIPPLAEQHRIVTKVDELMALCDQLKSRITDASRLQQKLADVLVGQAVA
ncbi:MAG: restriction endonuclease subunit S [Gallionella sp.]|jgi:type I restriction enzyme S subunit